jgi:hypothetical protein
MVAVNNVELEGTICNIKKDNYIISFSLNIANGKGKDGKYQRGFVNCRYFGEDELPEDGSTVVATGWLRDNSYTSKDGRKIQNTTVCAKEIILKETPEERKARVEKILDKSKAKKEREASNDFFENGGDDVPF